MCSVVHSREDERGWESQSRGLYWRQMPWKGPFFLQLLLSHPRVHAAPLFSGTRDGSQREGELGHMDVALGTQILVLPPTTCVASNKLLNLSETQFPHL